MRELFYLVSMLGKGGTVLYLMEGDNDKSFKWTKDYDQALWFNTDYEASSFARGYFKTFKAWSVTALDVDLSSIV